MKIFSLNIHILAIVTLFTISCARPLYIPDYGMLAVHKKGVNIRSNSELVNGDQLKSLVNPSTKKITVGDITKTTGRIDMKCRLGSVNFKEGVNLENYIKDAVITELKAANIYSESSNKKLSGNIDSVSLNTTGTFTVIGALISPSLDQLTDGKWGITVTFNGEEIKPFTIPSVYLFPVHEQGKTLTDRLNDPLGPDGPCVNPHYKFKDAVANLIKILFKHPSFTSFLNEDKK
jgi:hypothetical protein